MTVDLIHYILHIFFCTIFTNIVFFLQEGENNINILSYHTVLLTNAKFGDTKHVYTEKWLYVLQFKMTHALILTTPVLFCTLQCGLVYFQNVKCFKPNLML